jgi:hypothetical protein
MVLRIFKYIPTRSKSQSKLYYIPGGKVFKRLVKIVSPDLEKNSETLRKLCFGRRKTTLLD